MNDLPKRKQIRLANYDYSENGYYFVTICTKDKKPLLRNNVTSESVTDSVGADIIRPENRDDYSKLTECGKIADMAINEISTHYPNVIVDKYVIMSNHIHLILIINGNDESGRIISAPTVMRIIGQMKRYISKQIGYPIWQKSYYEHIIRNETDYLRTLEYIINNPLKSELKRDD